MLYVYVHAAAFTLDGLSRPHQGKVIFSWVGSPGVAAFIGFAAQSKPVRFVNAEASALHTASLLVLIKVTRGIGA